MALLVEAGPGARSTLANYLVELGWSVVETSSMEEALRFFYSAPWIELLVASREATGTPVDKVLSLMRAQNPAARWLDPAALLPFDHDRHRLERRLSSSEQLKD